MGEKMTLREAIEILAKGYVFAATDGEKAAQFDQALDIALLAAASHEARCAMADTAVGDYHMRNFRESYANHTFKQLRAAEGNRECLTVS